MQAITIDVGAKTTHVLLRLKGNSALSKVILNIPQDVKCDIDNQYIPTTSRPPRKIIIDRPDISEIYETKSGFPPRAKVEKVIINILKENNGAVKIRDEEWNIYDEVAARLKVPFSVRRRLTEGTAEQAWRPYVGFTRKGLEQRGVIVHTEISGRGIWQLSNFAP